MVTTTGNLLLFTNIWFYAEGTEVYAQCQTMTLKFKSRKHEDNWTKRFSEIFNSNYNPFDQFLKHSSQWNIKVIDYVFNLCTSMYSLKVVFHFMWPCLEILII